MTHEEKAASLSRDEIVALLATNDELTTEVEALRQQLDWLKRQLFGPKSERRLPSPPGAEQLALGSGIEAPSGEPPSITVQEHARHTARPKWEGTSDSRLRFDPSVPVREILVSNPDTELYPPEAYDVVGEKVTYRLAQLPGTFVVLKFVRKVLKLKDRESFSCPAAPPAVFEKSIADVSFLAGLLVDKFRYHLPLYRQHQRLKDCGIVMARATLTQLVHRSIALLEPIEAAQRQSILESAVLAMDETPIRAGRTPGVKGKMHQGYFWPLFGDRREVAFPFSPSRSLAAAREILQGYKGKIVSDGYSVYDRYVEAMGGMQHAQCWSHARRKFVEAESAEPALCAKALEYIGRLYEHEAVIREHGLQDPEKGQYRVHACKPVVEDFFSWLRETLRDQILLPSNPFTRAASYALEREAGLRVFLEDSAVPIDTNHLEREIRPIAVGRKNWLFCWTEVGARYVGIIQGLIATCRIHDVDPYTYLVDVLQRVSSHPASEVEKLTPRLWKELFAANPLRSDVEQFQRSVR